MANLSGLLNGQTDPILTINGRKAGNVLYPGLYKSFDQVQGIWSSDLQRCSTFADIATGFYGEGFWKTDKNLREIDFGDVSLSLGLRVKDSKNIGG
jgi:broad specificity phosphatase PhoE